MQVVTFATRKGGSVKSTLACHWAVLMPQPCLIVDLDPQRSAGQWALRRRHPYCGLGGGSARLEATLREYADAGYRSAVVDAAGAFDVVTVRAIEAADLVITPVRPTALDIDGPVLEPLLEVVDNTRHLLVLNQAPRSPRLIRAARAALDGLDVCPHVIHTRVSWQVAMGTGKTVYEGPSPRLAAAELDDVWRYAQARYPIHATSAPAA